MSIENQPRASSVEDYLETERTHAWSKAYLVADSMRLRPDKLMAEAYVRVMFDCSMEMGHGFTRSIEVVNEINAWPEVHKCSDNVKDRGRAAAPVAALNGNGSPRTRRRLKDLLTTPE